jgi:Holliday junction DNA helicase RuvA
MIGFLRGKVAYLYQACCLLDVNGVGYRVYISAATHEKLHLGEEIQVFTYLSVHEDDMTLYGFAAQAEYDAFQLLISVSGIGPKVALGILSGITVEKLCRAIHSEQTAVLTKLPGIGKKSAERLILELKDKVDMPVSHAAEDGMTAAQDMGTDGSEAEAALLSLGYTQAEVDEVLAKVPAAGTTEAVIKAALKEFARR